MAGWRITAVQEYRMRDPGLVLDIKGEVDGGRGVYQASQMTVNCGERNVVIFIAVPPANSALYELSESGP